MTERPRLSGESLSWEDLDCNRLHGDQVVRSRYTFVNYFWFTKHPEVIKWMLTQNENPVVMQNMDEIMVEAYAELIKSKVHSSITHPQYVMPTERGKYADLIIFLQNCSSFARYLTTGSFEEES